MDSGLLVTIISTRLSKGESFTILWVIGYIIGYYGSVEGAENW